MTMYGDKQGNTTLDNSILSFLPIMLLFTTDRAHIKQQANREAPGALLR